MRNRTRLANADELRNKSYDDLPNFVEAANGLYWLCAIIYVSALGWSPVVAVGATYGLRGYAIKWRHSDVAGAWWLGDACMISRAIFRTTDGERYAVAYDQLPNEAWTR